MATPANIALRFRDDDRQIIRALQQATGQDMTGVIRLAIRESAMARGIALPQQPAPEPKPVVEKKAVGRPRVHPEPDPTAPKRGAAGRKSRVE